MDATVGQVHLDPGGIVHDHRARVYGYLLGMTRDPEAAEDLTQETFLRALGSVGSLREQGALVSWLYRIATNVFLDRVRAEGRRRLADADEQDGPGSDLIEELPDPGPRVDLLAEQAEMSECVRGVVDEMPDDYRAVLLLHDAHGLSSREIAELLDISVATAKIRIHRARARLRAALEEACTFETDDRGVLVCVQCPSTPHGGCASGCS